MRLKANENILKRIDEIRARVTEKAEWKAVAGCACSLTLPKKRRRKLHASPYLQSRKRTKCRAINRSRSGCYWIRLSKWASRHAHSFCGKFQGRSYLQSMMHAAITTADVSTPMTIENRTIALPLLPSFSLLGQRMTEEIHFVRSTMTNQHSMLLICTEK